MSHLEPMMEWPLMAAAVPRRTTLQGNAQMP